MVARSNITNFPCGIVYQDAHPAQFHFWEGKFTLLDPDSISYDYAFADLTNAYLYKIVRAYAEGVLSEKRTLELLNAVLIPRWIEKYGKHILSHTITSFWNHSINLVYCYNLHQENSDDINLGFTLKSFLCESAQRLFYDKIYREQLFPQLFISQ